MKNSTKRPRQAYINKVKERAVAYESGTYTFRFNVEMMKKFKAICEENEITMTNVLREFIEDFVGQK